MSSRAIVMRSSTLAKTVGGRKYPPPAHLATNVCRPTAHARPKRLCQEIELISGEIHRAMGLENAMPAVCSALGGGLFERLADVRIVERQGPRNGATVRVRYALDAPAAADWAEIELRRRYGAPIVDTVKMLEFALTDARQLALRRDGRAVQLRIEDDPARPSLPADQV